LVTKMKIFRSRDGAPSAQKLTKLAVAMAG